MNILVLIFLGNFRVNSDEIIEWDLYSFNIDLVQDFFYWYNVWGMKHWFRSDTVELRRT